MTEGVDTVRARVIISGRVQGVFFRQETKDRARTRNIAGWITNRPDGRVEAIFEGNREAVESLVEWCRSGPRLAEVDSVEVEWESPSGERGFSVR